MMIRWRTVEFLVALSVVSGLQRTHAGDDFPAPHDTETATTRPLPAADAAAAFRVPQGFRVTTFAAEPDVRNPIAMAWDARGRLWVAENYTYAERVKKFDLALRDRILILEDTDGDGQFNRRAVFTDGPQRLTSLEFGYGGVWVLCPPQLLFVPDQDGDDVADGPAEVMLDGFDIPPENYHTIANGLHWGPDGWLYGRCGASSIGLVGAPGAAEAERVPLYGGLWRFHPSRKTFEVLTHGTTNPWGHDWNALGETFFVNTVNGHLWHAIPGMHFERGHTIDPNPRVYSLIDQHADHWHWDHAKDWTDSRKVTGEHDRRGGGHAHTGALIYQGNQWPDTYRDKLLTLNFHGRRINVDRLDRSGSGYVGRHEPDVIFAGDPWFRGLELSSGPDGGVSLLDWSDTGECHEANGVHRSSGRIFKVDYGNAAPVKPFDLARLDTRALAALCDDPNEWYVRQGRRLLADRAARGEPLEGARTFLLDRLTRGGDPARVLRALWALNAIGAADHGLLIRLLDHKNEAVRAWSIRLLTDAMPLDDIMSHRARPDVSPGSDLMTSLIARAKNDPSGLVRLVLASTLQRLPVERRAPLASALMGRSEDAWDHNIPQLIWYGLIPLAETDKLTVALAFRAGCALPATRRLIARRLAESIESDPVAVAELIDQARAAEDWMAQADVLTGMADGLRGRRKAPRPTGWKELADRLEGHAEGSVRDRVRELGVVFGDGRALEEVRRLALDDSAPLDGRREALQTLIDNRPPDLRAVCERLLRVRFLNATAARGLALFDDPEIGKSLTSQYRTFHPSERPAVLDTLVSRRSFARALLEAMAANKVPPADLTAFHVRQIKSLNDPELDRRLAEVWGSSRDSRPERQAIVARLKTQLAPDALSGADPGRGRALFKTSCSACHTLYGQGGQVGPDLTGSGRSNLDYLLENIIDPGATVTADYRMVVVAMRDGRVLNGLIKAKNERTLTLQTQNESIVVEQSEVEALKPTTDSLMPEGLLDTLKEAEIRDLFAYLMGRVQVPLPE